MKNKLMICRTESGITHPSSSSPFGHWAIMSHLVKKSSQRMLVSGSDDHDDEDEEVFTKKRSWW